MRKQQRYEFVLNYFRKHHPVAATELNYTNAYELIVAVILSAQCTDKRVNLTTPHLFKAFPDVYALSDASAEEVFPYIKSISYPNNKAKHLVGMAKLLVSNYNAKLPDTVDALQTLPGVGRKTANVIASVIYKKPAMAVDTHVFRVSNRNGLSTSAKTVLEVEKQLVKHIPESEIHLAHHWLILHGRYTCMARNPKCDVCPFTSVCKYYKVA